jgi:polyisoprenoid-binding protein YceI
MEEYMRRTSTLAVLILILGLGTGSAQGTYSIDTVHSSVEFKVRHLVSKVSGSFTEFDGTITADFANLDASGVELVIKTASIDTKNEKRDGHLRSPDFFDVEQYPEITFKSSKITKIDDDSYAVAGTLTMHGVSRPIILTVDYLGEVSAMGGIRAGYELSTTVNRKEYGVSWNRALDSGGWVLGDDVEVNINLEVVKQEEAE